MKKRKEVKAMAREDLQPVRTKEEAKKRGRAGGIKSGEARRARKTLKEELLLLLSQGNTQEKISLALISKALNGDTKAFEVIRDSIGERQTDRIEQDTNATVTVKLAGDVEEWGK